MERMEKKMDTTRMGYIYRGYMEIMEKKMEITILGCIIELFGVV